MLGITLTCTGALAADEVRISGNDTVQSVLTSLKGKRVTVRVRSGQELTGTVRDATGRLVQLGGLSGKEFYDAVIPLDAVDAVLVRTKD
jgi:hypothetical protein